MSTALDLPRTEANEQLARMRNMVSGIRRRAQEQSASYLRTGIVAGSGFALGAVDARWGEDAAFGMSTSLAAGILGHGLALLDVGGAEMTNALQGVGDAGFAIYAYKSGFDLMTRRMGEGEGEGAAEGG